MAIKTQKIVADLETTTTPEDVRAWGVCAVDIDSLETVYLGNELDGFMEWLKDKNTVCYFHNAKFDLEFVLPYLFHNQYKHSTTAREKHFTTLITDDGVVYSLTVYFKKENKKWRKVTFYDSLKKLPFKAAKIAEDFKLPDKKLTIDYDAPRPRGHELTEEEKAYIINDCRIIAQALKIQFAEGLKKMTNASDAMHGYKTIISPGQFDRWFPELPIAIDDEIRRAYKGGYVYLNPKYKNKRGLQGFTVDINSLYPWTMYECLLPYSYPVYFEGEPEPDDTYPLYIVHFKCCFELKPGHLPTLQLKKNYRFIETEYLTTSEIKIKPGVYENEPVEMVLTSVDYELFKDHYNISDETYINGYKFKGAHNMFTEYIDYWMHIKETTTGARRSLSKLMLNSLYGRYALTTRPLEKWPRMDADGVVRYDIINEKYCEEHKLPPPEIRPPVYTALAAFVTSYARNKTIRSAQKVYDRFIYADTDSLSIIGYDVPEELDIHPTRLGAWKHEGEFTDSIFLRAKTYMKTVDGEIKVTCAGMPDNVKEDVTYDNFHYGSTFEGKLEPKRYPGGVVLMKKTFTIK